MAEREVQRKQAMELYQVPCNLFCRVVFVFFVLYVFLYIYYISHT